MTSAIAVAQAFLDLAAKERRSLTNMQLQKLVFFSHGIHLAAFGDSLIEEPVKAWDFGPVIPALYEKLRRFGRGDVSRDLAPETRGTLDPSGKEFQAIRAVWKAYGNRDGWSLSEISHQEGSPWDAIWNKHRMHYCDIPNDLIRSYYSDRVKHTGASQVA
ncbi:Panacea domain-containing protein [Pseudomonas gingeri]|uniref:Panacea domain-containing protein n=1 Tax=Pseudomonas gingeri TaxID=117681 RepID=UPI0015A16971|nr:type II toxin-antitoxin system antitoxin SocA domain-containing protein [Pseudomonas gingeri]NWE46989.1 SocA family protein [Pseudomonas gingeri]